MFGIIGVELFYFNCFNFIILWFFCVVSLFWYYLKNVVIYVVLNGGYVDF